jgi:hypothetical protein
MLYPTYSRNPCAFLFSILYRRRKEALLALMAMCSVYVLNGQCSQIPIEGFGASATGGPANTNIYHVTTLTGSGSGSLRYGLFTYNSSGSKTIIFDVSGTIYDAFTITSMSYVTIDGGGQDVTIDAQRTGTCLSIEGSGAHHIIIRNLHVTNGEDDGFNIVDGAHDIAITNCTAYGATDGNIDIAADNAMGHDTKDITIQWCILGNGASGSPGPMLVTGQNVTIHHNLFVPRTSGGESERSPFVHADYSPVGSPNADIRNNIVSNWGDPGNNNGSFGTAVGFGATANVINNYYYSDLDGDSHVCIGNGFGSGTANVYIYIDGNVSGNSEPFPNSTHAVWTVPAVSTQSAYAGAVKLLALAGPDNRNSVDISFINQVTLPGAPIAVSAKIFLQGSYNTSTGYHKNVTTAWASVLNATSGGGLAQPYNISAFGSYAGTESVSTGYFTSDNGCNKDIVDWVLVELRDATTPSTIVARRAAFVREDGIVVDLDGVSPVTFKNYLSSGSDFTTAGNYYLAIRHRNHLGVRSAATLSLNGGSVATYDFTTAQSQAYQNASITSNAAMKELGSNKFGMWGGNANGNNSSRATGGSTLNDYLFLINTALGGNIAVIVPNVYNTADMNMDGTIRASGGQAINDYLFLINLVLGGNIAVILTQHL